MDDKRRWLRSDSIALWMPKDGQWKAEQRRKKHVLDTATRGRKQKVRGFNLVSSKEL